MTTGGRADEVDGGLCTQRATHTIQVASHQIDQLCQPMAQRAEGLSRHAHSPITHRLVSGREIPCQLPDLLGSDTAARAHDLCREAGNGVSNLLQTVDRQVALAGQPLLE